MRFAVALASAHERGVHSALRLQRFAASRLSAPFLLSGLDGHSTLSGAIIGFAAETRFSSKSALG